eukprot:COSAG01_NODE_425_length_17240_cov_29.899306_17_plen_126_part_00
MPGAADTTAYTTLNEGLAVYPSAPQDGGAGTAAAAPQGSDDSKVSKLKRQVENVKGVMNRNIDVMLANSNDLEGLRLKTEEMEALSKGFNKNAKQARRKMQWRRIKATGAVVGIAAGCVAAPFLL